MLTALRSRIKETRGGGWGRGSSLFSGDRTSVNIWKQKDQVCCKHTVEGSCTSRQASFNIGRTFWFLPFGQWDASITQLREWDEWSVLRTGKRWCWRGSDSGMPNDCLKLLWLDVLRVGLRTFYVSLRWAEDERQPWQDDACFWRSVRHSGRGEPAQCCGESFV